MTGTDADVIMTFVQAKPVVHGGAWTGRGGGSEHQEGVRRWGGKRHDQKITDKGSARQWINLEDKEARIKD